MMKSILIFMLLFLSAPLVAGEVVSIRMGDHGDKSRMVIDFNGDVDFQAKIDDQTLVVHLPKKSFVAKPRLILPFQSIKTDIIGDELLKLSIPLSEPYKIKTAFVIQGDPHRLVVDIMQGSDDDIIIHGPMVIEESKIETTHAKQKPIIMIDAGHGGHDSGAVGANNIREKDIVLSIAKLFANQLNQSGRYTAKLTRDDDKFIPLHKRIDLAQDANADLFISIHADSLRGEQAQGASVYTLSKNASDAQTAKLVMRENLMVNAVANQTDTNINEILVTMAMDDTIDKSKNLALNIVQSLQTSNIPIITMPHRHGGFVVLKSSEIPSVLFETGFISDKEQAKKLIDPLYQKQISQALLNALDEYFGL